VNFRPGRISIVSCAWRLLIQLGYQNPQLSESTVLSTTLNFKQNPPRNAHNRWRRQIIYSTDLKPSTLIMSTAARRRLMRDFKVLKELATPNASSSHESVANRYLAANANRSSRWCIRFTHC